MSPHVVPEVTSESRDMSYYRAPSLFQPHRCRDAIRDAHTGKIPPMIGAWIGITALPVSLIMAPMGFDHVFVDWAHSNCNTETMTQMVHNISLGSEGKTIPWVRVPGHDHAKIAYALDAGASIMIPQVDTVEQAKHVISSAKFGTKVNGTRSAPPFRLIPGLTDSSIDPGRTLHQNLNNQAAIMIQIETLEGINNLDAILTEVPDIDAVWLGSLDVRVSMDLPANMGFGGSEPEWAEAVEIFKKTLEKHSHVALGGFAMGDDEGLVKMGKGKSIIVTAGDIIAMMGLPTELARSRKMFPAI